MHLPCLFAELGGRWKPLHYFAVKFFAPLTFMLWIRDGVVSVFPSDYRYGADMRPGTLQVQLHSWSQLAPVFSQRIPNVTLHSLSLTVATKLIVRIPFEALRQRNFSLGKTAGFVAG